MQNKKLNLTRTTIHSGFWVLVSNFNSKLMAFIATIILARLLTQEDFGLAGYAFIVINYLQVLEGLGIGPALIYHDKNPERSSSGFWLGLGMGLVMFILTWLIAPFAGHFFNDTRAIPLIRALSLTLPLSAVNTVPRAMLRKNLAFKRKFIPEFVSAMSKGLVSIVLALVGFGVWSLIWGQIAGVVLAVVAFWWIVPWRPSFRFNPQLARSLLSYGTTIISVRTLSFILANIDYLFVGYFFGTATLGVYTLAFRMPDLLIRQFSLITAEVLFPVYAKMRHDPKALRRGFLTTIQYISMITVPVALGLVLVSKPFVLTAFGQKWIDTIPVMHAISILALLRTLSSNSGDIYKAQGRPGILMKLSLVRLASLVPVLWWAATGPGTLVAIGWTMTTIIFFNTIFHFIVVSRILNIQFRMIMKAFRPAAISGAIMTSVVLGTTLLLLPANVLPLIQLVVSVTVGALTYAGALWWLQRDVVIRVGHTLHAALVK